MESQIVAGSEAREFGQPVLGFSLAALIILAAFGIISLFDEPVFSTWVAFLWMACVPMMLVLGIVWGGDYPPNLTRLPQPMRGLALLGLCICVGALVAYLTFSLVGEGRSPPLPPFMMYIIFGVVCTFWFTIVWQCWPVTAVSSHPLIAGISVLLFTYVGGWALFQFLFDFRFMAAAPVYVASMDPGGLFSGWTDLSFGVTTVAVIMTFVMLDFWLLQSLAGRQPLFSIVASMVILGIAAAIYSTFVHVLGFDQVQYMVHGPIPYLFGTFFPLTLFENSLLKDRRQPVRGLAFVVVSFVIGNVLQVLYWWAGPHLSGPLVSGPPNYQQENWLASALLGITFPLIVIWAELFQFWPLRRRPSRAGAAQ